jgi:hypothetical protein
MVNRVTEQSIPSAEKLTEPFFREAGSGPGVVCIHSNASTSGQWRGLMDRLAPRFRVFAPDSYDAGKSPQWPSDRVIRLRDEVGLIERFGAAGVPKEQVTCVRDTYSFEYPHPPAELVAAFRNYYGPTMNAFEAAEKNGRAADLQNELVALFESQNRSSTPRTTSIPATFLRVTVLT